jgi:hypothetical protein
MWNVPPAGSGSNEEKFENDEETSQKVEAPPKHVLSIWISLDGEKEK